MSEIHTQSEKAKIKYITSIRNAPRKLFLGLAIMLCSSVLGGIIFHQEQATVAAVRLVRDVAAGNFIEASAVEKFALPQSLAGSTWLTMADINKGVRLNHPVHAGEFLLTADITAEPALGDVIGYSSLSASLPALLHVGDSLTAWRVDPDAAAATYVIAPQVELLALAVEDGGQQTHLTLRVSPDVTPEILAAVATGQLQLVGAG